MQFFLNNALSGCLFNSKGPLVKKKARRKRYGAYFRDKLVRSVRQAYLFISAAILYDRLWYSLIVLVCLHDCGAVFMDGQPR